MPIKRRVPKRAEHPISPAAIAAFIAQDERELHRHLGLNPWQASPLDCDGECPWPAGTAAAGLWPVVAQLRAELMQEAPHAR